MLVLNAILVIAGGWMIASFVNDCQHVRSAPGPVGQLEAPGQRGVSRHSIDTKAAVAEAVSEPTYEVAG